MTAIKSPYLGVIEAVAYDLASRFAQALDRHDTAGMQAAAEIILDMLAEVAGSEITQAQKAHTAIVEQLKVYELPIAALHLALSGACVKGDQE